MKIVDYDWTPVTTKREDSVRIATEVLEAAQQGLKDAEAALAIEQAEQAFKDGINKHIRLAMATVHALRDVRDLRGHDSFAQPRMEFIEFRKELAETLQPYNAKIVLVGDKSQAAVVLN
jgi:hypothetical protein